MVMMPTLQTSAVDLLAGDNCRGKLDQFSFQQLHSLSQQGAVCPELAVQRLARRFYDGEVLMPFATHHGPPESPAAE